MRNARFWVIAHGEPVKLTLRPGTALTHFEYSACSEGWTSETTTWHHAGPSVVYVCDEDGRDCDGRLTRHYVRQCPLGRLACGQADALGVVYPDWEPVESSQRDYQAEAAGY